MYHNFCARVSTVATGTILPRQQKTPKKKEDTARHDGCTSSWICAKKPSLNSVLCEEGGREEPHGTRQVSTRVRGILIRPTVGGPQKARQGSGGRGTNWHRLRVVGDTGSIRRRLLHVDGWGTWAQVPGRRNGIMISTRPTSHHVGSLGSLQRNEKGPWQASVASGLWVHQVVLIQDGRGGRGENKVCRDAPRGKDCQISRGDLSKLEDGLALNSSGPGQSLNGGTAPFHTFFFWAWPSA